MNTLLVGWNELGHLPGFGLKKLPIKIDTGAKTSSLHAVDIQTFIYNNKPWVRFTTEDNESNLIQIEALIFDQREVTSSNGQVQERFVIETTLELGGQRWEIQLTLTDRSKMKYKMLLGRRAMDNIQVIPSKEQLAVS